jgi:hypothetical protein
MKNIFLFIFIISIVLNNYSHAGNENRNFENARLAFINKLEFKMIGEGICRSTQDCQRKKLFFVSPKQNGFHIEIWGGDKNALYATLSQASTVFEDFGGRINIKIEFHLRTKDGDLAASVFDKSRPNIIISFDGEH